MCRRRLTAVLLVPVAAVLLTGCTGNGGNDGGGNGDRTAGPATPPPVTATPQVGVSTRPPVRIGRPAEISPDVAVTVSKVGAVQLTGTGPGETSGPGARVTIGVRNTSGAPIDLGQLAVTASYGRGIPASPITSEGPAPLTGTLAAGAARTGTYQYRLPKDRIGSLRVEVSSGRSPYVLTFVP